MPRIRVNLKGKPSDYGLHPWIFRDRIKGVIGEGFEAAVYVKGKFFGSAFYNPEGKLALRFYSREEEDFTAGLVYSRIKRAKYEREDLLGFRSAYRLFFAEADNMPGIIADVYGDGAVIQISSYGADRLRREIVEGFRMAGYSGCTRRATPTPVGRKALNLTRGGTSTTRRSRRCGWR